MATPKSSKIEEYLRYVEEELMTKGGRWIANFDTAVRRFNIEHALKEANIRQKEDIDLLVYGGVRAKGLLLSRAFAFMASPTYRVACFAIHLKNASNAKWSNIIDWLREVTKLQEIMEVEWLWVLFFGEGKPSKKIIDRFKRFTQKDLALIYANLKHKEIYNSDSFIARRGEKLFDPKNLDRESFSIKFWKRSKKKVNE